MGFEDLPIDIIQLILYQVPPQNLGNISLICKRFCEAQTKHFWKNMYEKTFPTELVLESGKKDYQDTFKKRYTAEFYNFYNWTIIKYDGKLTLIIREEIAEDEYRDCIAEEEKEEEEQEEQEEDEEYEPIQPAVIAIQFSLADPSTYHLRYNECDWLISNPTKTVKILENKFTLPPWISSVESERNLRQFTKNNTYDETIQIDVPFVPKLEEYAHCQTTYYNELELFYRCGYSSHELIIKHPNLPCSIVANNSWSGYCQYSLNYYYAFTLELSQGRYENIPELFDKQLWNRKH